MREDDLRELFAPAGAVEIRRMFGGHGLYRDGRIVALCVDGGLYLKTDALSRPAFEAAGSRPFSYAKSTGAVTILGYWSLPEDALDEPDELVRWVRLAEEAALRADLKRTRAKR